jgi:hypothetical protein
VYGVNLTLAGPTSASQSWFSAQSSSIVPGPFPRCNLAFQNLGGTGGSAYS